MLRARQRGHIDIVLLLGPQQRGQRARRGLQQRREIDVIGAEADAVFAQRRARGLVEILHLGGDLRALQHAERLDQLKRDAARNAGDVFGLVRDRTAGPSSFSICVFSHRSSRVCTASRGAPVSRSSAMMRSRGCSASSAATSFATASPVQRMVPSDVSTNCVVGRRAEFFGARVDLAGQRLLRGRLQRLGVGAGLRRIWRKGESVEAADHMALNGHFAGLADFRIQNTVLPQAAHQYTGPAVNETLR